MFSCCACGSLQSVGQSEQTFFLDESQDSFVTSEHAQDKPSISKWTSNETLIMGSSHLWPPYLDCVTFPHNFGKLFLKNTQKLVAENQSNFPRTTWLFLLCPNQTLVADDSIFKQVHAFSEWILLGCQTCPLPSWAHWRNNSGIELLFVLVFTMVFKVISLNDFPCLWSVQVPCRCLTHSPYLSWRFAL